ncbi:MAG: hypothetical protein LRZ84_14685 [Desertifilum sp.]|nr:hypothetical protein [Desertifilum sp.]
MFTIREKDGDKYGTANHIYRICQVCASEESEVKAWYNPLRYVKGKFRVIAIGEGKTKASRLEAWWKASGKTKEEAVWFAQHINKRGMLNPPPIQPLAPNEVRDRLNNLKVTLIEFYEGYGRLIPNVLQELIEEVISNLEEC